ncbi:MAG: autotransporter-associated beta strand repeat-containing protein [Thermoguttaceae bacterium]|nr:autotransporter-associated beta strand repeat-containing protein [Thermoguttaceae bacterium]
MKTTRTTVFLSLLAILASFLFASTAALAEEYTNDNMPGDTLVTGTGEGGVGDVTFNISGTAATSVTYSGVISGSGSITKTGAGELVLSGASSDYTGTVNVNIGTLTLQNDETRFAGNISVNNEAVFKCGTRVPQISSLTVNNSGSFFIGATNDSYGVYLSEFTLNSGYVEFDINDSSTGAPEGLDYLYVNKGTFNNGVINITFNKQNDEGNWRDNAMSTGQGILLIEAGESLSFDKDSIRLYADGQQTDNWYLEQQGKYIYLKPTTTIPPTPSNDPWYHVYSSHDMGLDSWLMNNSPKIGVEFNSGAETAEFGTADDPRTITMYKNGDFKYGEYQIGEGHTLTIGAKISGDADLRKTGKGELILTADNDFTGDTYIEEGTLTLVVPNPTTAHKGTLQGGTTITVDGNLNDSSKAPSILNGHADIFGNRASSGEGATSIGLIRLINGGILQNDVGNNHITVSSIIEMENGVIQVKEAGTGSGAGNFLFDNAIHVLSGENNQITARTFSIRHHDYATYAEGEDAGYFYVEEGATLTVTSEIKNYNDQTIPFVKTGKGDLILEDYTFTGSTSDAIGARYNNLNGDFIVREGKVISYKKKDPASTFGNGAVIIEEDGWLECRVSNQFGYSNTVQKDIYVYGTLKPSTNTHMHELNLIGGTVEEEYVTSSSGDGLDFNDRAGKITSSGESIIKSKVTSGKSGSPGTMQIDVTDGNLTITGLVVGTSPFTKTGAGTLTLTNANTMSDSFTINNGVVVAGNEVALGTGAVTIGSADNAVGQLTIGKTSTEPLNLTVGGAVTVSGGQINFDFTDTAFDTLIASNGFTFTTGTFNLNFAQGTESTWFDNVPDEGYKIVSITGGYTGAADLTSYLSGRTQAWSLTATSDGIYLGKAENDPYWNPIRDDGLDWPIDGTNKIGVKYDEDDVKTASHDESISLDSPEGVFIIGEDYELEQAGPISGEGKLTKKGFGELFLTGENSYEGGTQIDEGSVVLVTDDNSDGTAGVGPIEIGEDGRLVYDVDEGYTKTIDNAITGTGTITKTGPGTLQATGTDDMPLQAADFDVDAGRLNLAGAYEGNLNVVGPLDDNGAETILSPGGSEGADKIGAATVYGDVTIDAGATGLFEFSKYNNDPLLRTFDTLAIEGDGTFTLDGSITLAFLNNDAAAWAGEGETYKLVSDENFYTEISDMSEFLANFGNLFGLLGVNGDGLYLVGLGAPDTPGQGAAKGVAP